MSKYSRDYYKRNRIKIREYQKKYRQSHPPSEKQRERMRAASRKSTRARYWENQEESRAKANAYYRQNPQVRKSMDIWRKNKNDNLLIVKQRNAEVPLSVLRSTVPSAEDEAMSNIESEEIRCSFEKLLGLLTTKERQAVMLRFLSNKDMTLEDIGAELGVSREAIRQRINGALRKFMGKEASKIFRNLLDCQTF